MATIDLAKKRIIDFDPLKCGLKNDGVFLFSPLDFIEGNIFYLPEKVRMPDGSINEKVEYDYWSFSKVLNRWDGEFLTMYAGKNYLQTLFNWTKGYISDREKNIDLNFPNISEIILYDETIDSYSSKNGILYCGDKVVFVPDCNPYAMSQPLEPLKGHNVDGLRGFENNIEGCGRDLFGGIYSLDGKTFISLEDRYMNSYQVRSGVEVIGNNAFQGSTLKRIIIPDSTKRINNNAFKSCRSLKCINLPENICEICDNSFRECQNLENIILPLKLRKIGNYAFSNTGIKSIYIPQSVKYIGQGCFTGCFKLSSITVEKGNNNYSSEDGILYNINKTYLICIPPVLPPDYPDNTNERKDFIDSHIEELKCGEDGIVHLDNFFEGVTYVNKTDKLTGEKYKEIIEKEYIDIRPTINLVVYSLFKGDKVYVEEGEFVKAGTKLVSHTHYELQEGYEEFYGPTRKEFTIPETVTVIGPEALRGCPFKKLTIPKSVINIGKKQFDWHKIEDIIVSPENDYYESRDKALIDKRRKRIIYWFGKEKEIRVPQDVEIIGEGAFDFVGFKSLIISEGVKCVEDNVWSEYEAQFIYLPASLCYIDSDAFRNINWCGDNAGLKIMVPHGLSQKYKKLLHESYSACQLIKEMEPESVVKESIDDYNKDLSICTDEELAQTITDEYHARYSNDGKRLLKFVSADIVRVKEGTEVICEKASEDSSVDVVHLPRSVKYIGIDGIDANTLILEGANAYFAGLYASEYNTIYIPCGSWGRYYNQIETNMSRSYMVQSSMQEYDDYESFREDIGDYKLIELSKANVSMYLNHQKEILISLIGTTKVLSEQSLTAINGGFHKYFVFFRTANSSFIFCRDNDHYIYYLQDVLTILGYSFEDVCNFLGINIEEVDVNTETSDCLVGRSVATRVFYTWKEDFVDEDTGDVVSIDRNEVIMEATQTLDKDNIEALIDLGISKIKVYKDYPDYNYSTLIGLYPESYNGQIPEKFRDPAIILKRLFPNKDPELVPKQEKMVLAHNLLTVYKGIVDYCGFVEDNQLSLDLKPEDMHTIITKDEKNLMDYISLFYDEKIDKIMGCETELDIMPLFTTDDETRKQLVSFLIEKGISERIIDTFINQTFDTLYE